MDLFLIFILLISIIGIQIYFKGYNKEYLNFSSTNCIKGIFLLFVFFSHAIAYVSVNHWYDRTMLFLQSNLRQLIVVMFFFYSGYGIYETIKKKKNDYIDKIPKNRVLKTLFIFDIAILLFILVNIILKRSITIPQILFSFIGWDSVGNSNWFIFDILCLYLISYISFKAYGMKKGILAVWIYTFILIFFLITFKQGWWYNTLLCFPLGITYSFYKDKIETLVQKDNLSYIVTLLMMFLATFAFTFLCCHSVWYYELWAMSFTLLIVFITMKINFKSPILEWLGKNLFWLYILQRIPFMILSTFKYNLLHPYRFFAFSFVITIALAAIFNKVFGKLTNKIFKK